LICVASLSAGVVWAQQTLGAINGTITDISGAAVTAATVTATGEATGFMSNSILIVEFAHHLRSEGKAVAESVIEACRVRLRPILMTSLATIIGLLPMALKLGEGSESYAPLARALVGGLLVSVALTVFLVPAGFYWVYGRHEQAGMRTRS